MLNPEEFKFFRTLAKEFTGSSTKELNFLPIKILTENEV